jgi:hypothetical protein
MSFVQWIVGIFAIQTMNLLTIGFDLSETAITDAVARIASMILTSLACLPAARRR